MPHVSPAMAASGARSVFGARGDSHTATVVAHAARAVHVEALPLMTTEEHEARIRRVLAEGARMVEADYALLETIEKERRGLLSPERLQRERPRTDLALGTEDQPAVPGGADVQSMVQSSSVENKLQERV